MSKSPADESTHREAAATPGFADAPVGKPHSDVVDTGDRVGTLRWLAGLGLRFGILYAGLFIAARVAGVMPGRSGLAGYYYRFKLRCVDWVAEHVLRLGGPTNHVSDWSGDQVYDWVLIATLLGVALAGALVWMGLDRSRRRERLAVEIIRIVMRYRLGATMLGYGIDKVLLVQMPRPSIDMLLRSYGESSPMGLLWTFMGQSWIYSAFTGGLEMVGGLLLLFRRTTTLGALIVAGVMLNVLMLNFGYDVPVKLYSTHYLVFAMALAAPDLRRLANLFVFNRATSPVTHTTAWPGARVSLIVKVLAISAILGQIPIRRTWIWIEWQKPTKSELYGLYEVEKFTLNGTERAPLTTDSLRWRRVGFDAGGLTTVVFMNDARKHFRFAMEGPGRLVLASLGERSSRGDVLDFVRVGADAVTIRGALNNGAVVIELRRAADEKLLLREREFRWVTDRTLVR